MSRSLSRAHLVVLGVETRRHRLLQAPKGCTLREWSTLARQSYLHNAPSQKFPLHKSVRILYKVRTAGRSKLLTPVCPNSDQMQCTKRSTDIHTNAFHRHIPLLWGRLAIQANTYPHKAQILHRSQQSCNQQPWVLRHTHLHTHTTSSSK